MSDCFKPNACKHAAIIEAGVAEFLSNGFAGASMDRIAAQSAVSKRTLYKYFESKENLFRYIVLDLAKRFKELPGLRYAPDRPIRDQLMDLAWAEAHLLLSPEVLAMSRMVISESLRSPEMAAEAQGKIAPPPAVREMLRAASADGALQIDDPDEAAAEFVALIKARAFWPAVMTGKRIDDARLADIVDSSVAFMLYRYGRESNRD